MTTTQFEKLKEYIEVSLKGQTNTEATVKQAIDYFSNRTISQLLSDPNLEITENDKENLFEAIAQEVFISWEPETCLIDEKTRIEPWFEEIVPPEKQYYWNRYAKYLEEKKHWQKGIQISNLDRISTEVINQAGNPKDFKSWKRSGLVIGEVQSGKTANYTAFCNKAADAGYDVIIILAGIAESLRHQTQNRLDSEFAGRSTSDNVGCYQQISSTTTGVGLFCDSRNIRTPINCTSSKTDFNTTLLTGQQFKLNGLKETAFFVLKKNSKVLGNVFNWLSKNNIEHGKNTINKSLLLIDDEADNASQNTKKEDAEPGKINGWIRKILNCFDRASYLAITATPFANIFVNPDSEDSDYGKGLFPKDYLFKLTKPSDYSGVFEFFGDDSDRNNINFIDEEAISDCLPLNHKKDAKLDRLPSDLYDAIRYFLLSNAILDWRAINKKQVLFHRSMLINISRFIKKHDEITKIINDWLEQVKSDVRNFSACPMQDDNPNSGELFQIKQVWKKYVDDPYCSWEEIREEYLEEAISSVSAVTVNQNQQASQALDFDGGTLINESHRFIFVGGFALSRGLTLEGLVVSYFYRRTSCYDTLLQMGRWFGYKTFYLDLVRIWTSSALADSYRDLACIVLPDLYRQIEIMNEKKLAPVNFGLMIRDDLSSLEITARNKMRYSKDMFVPRSIEGHLIETPRLINKKDQFISNNNTVIVFLAEVIPSAMREDSYLGTKGLLWHGIPGKAVASMVSKFKVHPWHLFFQSDSLAEYILDNQIDNWDLYIAGNKEESKVEGTPIPKIYFPFIDQEINPIPRKVEISKTNENELKISGSKVKVGQGNTTRVGLSQTELDYAIKNVKEGEKITDYVFLNVPNRKPLLVIYPVVFQFAKNSASKEQIAESEGIDYVLAIGLGFPGNAKETKKVHYKINAIKYLEEEKDDE